VFHDKIRYIKYDTNLIYLSLRERVSSYEAKCVCLYRDA